MITHLSVQGMSCQNCVRHVKEALLGVDGVEVAEVDLAGASATVTHAESVAPRLLVEVVTEEGYDAQVR